MSNVSVHIPVLESEVVTGLNLKPGDTVIDATLGGGGHAQAILEATAPDGKLLGIDWDPQAIKLAQEKLKPYQNRVVFKVGNYRDLKNIAYESGFAKADAVLLDLGLSSDQLQDKSRGFSFQGQGPLDMRFSDEEALTASEIVNSWSEKDLAHVFRTYGEERHAARIAHLIAASRQRAPLHSVLELVELVRRGAGSRGGRRNPATRVFQALRLAVNRELENLAAVLPEAALLLAPGGRIAVVSWHSLEDRIVKNFFRQEARALSPRLKIINKKVIVPSREEIRGNPRARSAKLRIAEKIEDMNRTKLLFLPALIFILLLLYLFQTNGQAGQTFSLRELELERANLQTEIRNLNWEIASVRSLAAVGSRAGSLRLAAPVEVSFIAGGESAVALSR